MLVTFDAKVKKKSKPKFDASSTKKSQFLRDNFNVIEDPLELQTLLKSNRSKNGCLTCKTRKKKCTEEKPACANCVRLNRECIWIDPLTMTQEQIEAKKRDIEQSKSRHKRKQLESAPEKQQISAKKDTSPKSSASFLELQFSTTPQISTTPRFSMGTPSPKLSYSPVSNVRTSPIEETVEPQQILGHPLVSLSSQELLLAFHMYHVDFPHKQESPDEAQVEEFLSLDPQLDIPNATDQLVTYTKEITSTSLHDFLRDLGYQTNEDGIKLSAHHTPVISATSSAISLPELLEQAGSKLSPSLFDQLVTSFANNVSTPQHSPSVIPLLNQEGFYLYDYYLNTLSRKVSIAPSSQDESNSYQKVFLPLAHKDDGVLYAILAWSCFDLNGPWTRKGMQYIEAALKHLETHHSENLGRHRSKSRDSLIFKLASLLIMCSAEICRGDVKRWPLFLSWGSKILSENGGIFNFNNDKEERWLITDFAYHDLLASSLRDRRPYFPTQDYARFFKTLEAVGQGGLNPLLGISKMLYPIIGDINTLAFESRRASNQLLDSFQSDIVDVDDDLRNRVILPVQDVLMKCRRLDARIDGAKPEPEDLVNLTDEELEHQLTIFETFQLTAKLFLRQAVLRCSPRHLESQVLTVDLLKCIDILIDTPAQASLVFPVFMAGIHSITEKDRQKMKARIDRYMQSYAVTSISRVTTLMERVWELNPNGDAAMDWFKTLEEFEWDLNFC